MLQLYILCWFIVVQMTFGNFFLCLWHTRFRILPHSLSFLVYKYVWGPCMIYTDCTHIKSIEIIFTAHLNLSHTQSPSESTHFSCHCGMWSVQDWNFPLCIFFVLTQVSHKNVGHSWWNSHLKLALHPLNVHVPQPESFIIFDSVVGCNATWMDECLNTSIIKHAA
jgi:hypothetical protein